MAGSPAAGGAGDISHITEFVEMKGSMASTDGTTNMSSWMSLL